MPSRWGCCHPHPSQIRMCRFPASGSSWESLAHSSVAMDDPRGWQWVPLEKVGQTFPSEAVRTPSPRQPLLPYPHRLVGIPSHSAAVATDAVVGAVTSDHQRQVRVLVPQRQVPVMATPFRYCSQRSGVPVFSCQLPQHRHACPQLAPRVGEPEKLKPSRPPSEFASRRGPVTPSNWWRPAVSGGI
jgi:hypothetical protein